MDCCSTKGISNAKDSRLDNNKSGLLFVGVVIAILVLFILIKLFI